MMNCARRLLLHSAAATRTLHKIPTMSTARYYHHRTAATAQQRNPGAFLGSILRCKPPAVVIRPPTPAATYQSPWYHDPRKVTAAGALVAAATCRLERVPCSNRVHVVILSHQRLHKVAESQFAHEKSESEIVDPHHPDSIRVHHIAERILHAAYRGLGVDGSRNAIMLRRAMAAGRKARWWTSLQPHTGHLGDGLEWEVLLRKDHRTIAVSTLGRIMVNTGILDHFKTDAEIAAILAHEIGHTIARHVAQITTWIPVPGLRLPFERRKEFEAYYIGILLLGAAGFHPRNAHVTLHKLARIIPEETVLERIVCRSPSIKKRLEHLSQANVMEEALELYREVIAMETVTNPYFSDN